ncbi:MAG TPA: DUF2510 domain-containing protein [Acidimicrobiales bacterium]|nr:DUF2510 domain-containing protein [Acidimicrobiales bacterium]
MIDGKSLGFMPVPVCLTEGGVIVVAKDGVQRMSVEALSSVDVGGARLAGGSLTLKGARVLEITGDLATPPEWYPDPSGRHHYRYWDGSAWAEDVATDGVVSTDPLPPESR